jgi:hypothetical protein
LLVFYLTFPFLLVLALSYIFTRRSRLLSLEFAFWLITYQFIFIGALGIGLIQSHVGCPMPLAECYVDGYPEELDIFKLLLELVVLAWVLGAVVMSVFNVISIWWKIGSND